MTLIHFLNVKNGDCSIIQHESGRFSVIDVCNARKQYMSLEEAQIDSSATKSFSIPKGNFNQKEHPENPIVYLKSMEVDTIFRYIQTHPDMDHMDGIKDLFETFEVLNFWDIENNKKIDSFDGGQYRQEDWDFYQKIRKSQTAPKSLHYYAGNENEYYTSDGISILAPTTELNKLAKDSDDYNDSSYVLLLKTHGRKIIFAGDSGEKTWDYILKNHRAKVSNVDFLLAPHHGRKTGGNENYLDILKPKVTLFGNTENNTEHLDYPSWSKRGLLHFTNNEAGNLLVGIDDNGMCICCSNKNFADRYAKANLQELESFDLHGTTYHGLCGF